MCFRYGSKNWDSQAVQQMEDGHTTLIRVYGQEKTSIYRLISLYAEYNQLQKAGMMKRKTYFCLAYRLIMSPRMSGILSYSRKLGFGIKLTDKGDYLEISFIHANQAEERRE